MWSVGLPNKFGDHTGLSTTKLHQNMSKYFFFLPIALAPVFSAAQPGSTSEATVQLQEIFLDGIREKLLGNYDKAAAKFEELLQKDTENDAAAYELARVYDALKQPEKAIQFAQKAVTLEAANAWYHLLLAGFYQKEGKDKDAAAVYEQLVKLEPENQEYYLKWAYFLVRASQPERAVKVYDDLEKRIGVNEETTRHKYTLYLGMGDYKKAVAELNKLIAIFPRKTDYRHLLANFYTQTGEKEKELEVYRQIIEIDPNDARAKIALANQAKGSSGSDANFLYSLQSVFENQGVHLDVKITEIMPFVQKLADTGDKELGNALLALTAILQRVHPNSAKALSVSGDVFYFTGQTDKALEAYKKTLELDDTVWLVWEQLLYIYAERKDYDNLVKESEKALEIFPNQASGYYLNGLGYSGQGKYKDALGSFQQTLLMTAKNPVMRYQALVGTGNAHFHLKQFPQSDKAFEDALQLNPNEPLVLSNYSYCLAARPNGASAEQLNKAKELATRLNELAPNHPGHLHSLAFVLYKSKDYKGAQSLLTKALEAGGDNDPATLELTGDVLFHLNKAAEAVGFWQKALEKGGNSPLLEKKITDRKLYE